VQRPRRRERDEVAQRDCFNNRRPRHSSRGRRVIETKQLTDVESTKNLKLGRLRVGECNMLYDGLGVGLPRPPRNESARLHEH